MLTTITASTGVARVVHVRVCMCERVRAQSSRLTASPSPQPPGGGLSSLPARYINNGGGGVVGGGDGDDGTDNDDGDAEASLSLSLWRGGRNPLSLSLSICGGQTPDPMTE